MKKTSSPLQTILFICFLQLFSCSENDETESNNASNTIPQSENNIDSATTTPEILSFNLNDGIINFEDNLVNFSEQNIQPDNRSSGNWGRFGGISSTNLSLEYDENPNIDNINNSTKVIKIKEPSGIQSWAGFYFVLEEKINFPEGKEAISILFYSPKPGHKVLLKLEDGLPNGTPGKKTTGDLFAITTTTGWETLIFNIPEFDGRNNIYNTITFVLGYDISNQSEVNYYMDNIQFSNPIQIIVDQLNIDSSEQVTRYSGYQLVWNDEFNYEGAPVEDKWHYQVIPILEGGWANNEKQHYTNRRENSYVSNGTLKIVAKNEIYDYEGITKSYTSARLNSKFDFQYGRIDVRAKLPKSVGTWPAIWTLGTNVGEIGNYHGNQDGNVGWPECGEIDIMEQNGSNKQILYGTFHWADNSSQQASYGLTKDINSLGITDVTNEFHLYSLEWTTGILRIYVDNLLICELMNNDSVPFDNPHYLILNVAMGGTLGGDIPGDFIQDSMEIDFVRFYK